MEDWLQTVPALQGRPVTREPLTGGMTNRNYLLKAGPDWFVLRVPGENSALLGIDRSVEHASALAAFHAGIAPEVVAVRPGHLAMLTRFVPGRALTEADLRSPAVLARAVQALRRFHDGPGGGGAFSPFATIRRYHSLALAHGVRLPPELGPALATLARLEQALGSPGRPAPCHNDLLASNFIQLGQSILILDWEYAGVGDVFFDLANLAANNLFTENEESLLLELYLGQVQEADRLRLRLLRAVSDLREALWGFLQIGLSRLEFDYGSYAARHLDRFMVATARLAGDLNRS